MNKAMPKADAAPMCLSLSLKRDGKTYSFEGDTASDPPQYEVNEKVSVLYDPSDPNTAQINKFSDVG